MRSAEIARASPVPSAVARAERNLRRRISLHPSDGPPLATDASSPPTSLSCSRPKPATLGSSIPPITSPHALPATAIRNPSPSRKPTPASKSPGPATIASTDRPSSTPIAKAAASPPSSVIRRSSSPPLSGAEISNMFRSSFSDNAPPHPARTGAPPTRPCAQAGDQKQQAMESRSLLTDLVTELQQIAKAPCGDTGPRRCAARSTASQSRAATPAPPPSYAQTTRSRPGGSSRLHNSSSPTPTPQRETPSTRRRIGAERSMRTPFSRTRRSELHRRTVIEQRRFPAGALIRPGVPRARAAIRPRSSRTSPSCATRLLDHAPPNPNAAHQDANQT